VPDRFQYSDDLKLIDVLDIEIARLWKDMRCEGRHSPLKPPKRWFTVIISVMLCS